MPAPLDPSRLDAARRTADPLADRCVARLLADAEHPGEPDFAHWHARLKQANDAMAGWRLNADVQDWQPPDDLPADMAEALGDYLREAQALPVWAEPARLERAETLFYEEGVLSCLLLFCASLPECYVVPDLAEVLQATAQLETRTEHRIRATAAMVFPVMMKGGMTRPEGSGRAQILKVRLIHATVRHLLLRGSPAVATANVPALEASAAAALAPGMHSALFMRGWQLERDGLPCNQEELAYTLLTFGYVMLRSLRMLGVGHSAEDEVDILHTWNAMGAMVGVEPDLMAFRMDEAEALFAQLQARGLQQQLQPDPRPALAKALIDCIAAVIPWRPAKAMPLLLTRRLIGRANAAAIGLLPGRKGLRAGPVAHLLFGCAMGLVRGVDFLGQRLVNRGFSIARLIGRLLGYQVITRLLMDQTRPLRLPETTQQQLRATVAGWGHDPRAPRWMNQLEDRFTMAGDWRAPLA